MSRTYFDKELDSLNDDLIRMGAMVEEAIAKSVKAMEADKRELALEVIEGDRRVDDMEKNIETRCLRLLLRQQPVAGDLRAISTAIKMVTDMERIGDQAADIADIALRYQHTRIDQVAHHIPKMAATAIEMVTGSIQAFVNKDLESARAIMMKDDVVDDLFNVVKKELLEMLATSPTMADEVLDAMMIAKYLERIGDHAVNICEWVEFYQTGVHKQAKLL